MYNLFISGHDEAWEGQSYILELSRCINVQEYTEKDMAEKYGGLNQEQIEAIKKLPCIFAYESVCKKDPKFGLIREITKRQGKVKIEYEIVQLEVFLSHSDILDMLFELDIQKTAMHRTHWAIKNIDLAKELGEKGILLPKWAQNQSETVDITKHVFKVSLSFPGEIRNYVEEIAVELEREMGPNSYFYDNNYKAQLARPELDTLLQDIYRNRSMLIVVFLCEKYQEKEWCHIEFRAIKEIIMNRDNNKIMFVRMDDGAVKGVFKTDGYIDGRTHEAKDIAGFIQERVSLISLDEDSGDEPHDDFIDMYEKFETFCDSVTQMATLAEKGNLISKFKKETDHISFIGMPEVEALRIEMVSKAVELQRVEARLNGMESKLPSEKYNNLTNQEAGLLNWFGEIKTKLKNLFLPDSSKANFFHREAEEEIISAFQPELTALKLHDEKTTKILDDASYRRHFSAIENNKDKLPEKREELINAWNEFAFDNNPNKIPYYEKYADVYSLETNKQNRLLAIERIEKIISIALKKCEI